MIIEHVLILMHGILGTAEKMSHFQSCIKEANPNMYVHSLESNATVSENKTKTLDGVDEGGKRAYVEIKQLIEKLNNEDHIELKYISILGFSLGGLYARYAAAMLYNKETNTMCGLKPFIFLSVASPHLGVKHFQNDVVNWLQTKVLQHRSFCHLFLQHTKDSNDDANNSNNDNNENENNNPNNSNDNNNKEKEDIKKSELLLLSMTRENQYLPFFESLNSFIYHRLYTNTQCDNLVSFHSSSILDCESKDYEATVDISSQHIHNYPSINKITTNSTPNKKSANTSYILGIQDDTEREIATEIISNLNRIQWEKVFVTLSYCNAHKCIAGNGILLNRNKGKDVAQHIGVYFQSKIMNEMNNNTT